MANVDEAVGAARTESGDPIDRPPVYRALLIAFAIWAAHFSISYGAVLVFPGEAIARIIAVVAGLAALAVLVAQARGSARPQSSLALGAFGLAAAAIVFGTFPAIVG